MKNKLLRTFGFLIISITFTIGLTCIPVHASWEIVSSDNGNTLKIHNEEAGKLLQGYIKESLNNIQNVVVTGKMNKLDFMNLRLITHNCKSIDLYNTEIDNIPAGSFRENSNLEKFVFPKNLRSIEALAFADCDNLEIEKLPENLEYIGDYAFEYCKKLNLTIPQKVKLRKGAFDYCPNIHFLEDEKTINTNENLISKTVFSAIVSYIHSWF